MTAGGRIFDGVGQEIEQHLPNAADIADQLVVDQGVGFDGHLLPFRLHVRCDDGLEFAQQLPNAEGHFG